MTIEEFRTFYPEFATVNDSVIQRYLDRFVCQFGADYGCDTDELQGLYTAHRVAIWQKTSSGANGPQLITTSRRVGDVAVSGEIVGFGDNSYGDYAVTSYGAQFWADIQMYGGGPIMA